LYHHGNNAELFFAATLTLTLETCTFKPMMKQKSLSF